MRVASIRRYPVKSMGGEALGSVELDARGLAGDRAWAVRDEDSRLASGKSTRRMVRRDAVFGFSAWTMPDGVVVSDGTRTWEAGSPVLDSVLQESMGAPVTLARESDVRHFDDGAVSLIGTATLDWCARELGVDADPRRLRVNLVVETDEPFVEESWFGRALAIGGVVLTAVQRIERCRTIDLAQNGVATRTRWLMALGASRDLRVAVYCDVAVPGLLAVGDTVLLD